MLYRLKNEVSASMSLGCRGTAVPNTGVRNIKLPRKLGPEPPPSKFRDSIPLRQGSHAQ